MALDQVINFVIGSVLFVRTLLESVFNDPDERYQDGKISKDKTCQVNGRGLKQSLPENLPSIIDIKNSIPKHCFKSSVRTSLYYTARDFAQVIVAYLVASCIVDRLDSVWLQAPVVCLYWAAQGTFFMALFVLGHDCGHGSFSDYKLLNDIVGTVSHCILFVPYYQWKLSHRHHHKNTANMDKDEVFYPVKKSEHPEVSKMLPGFALGFGWYIYLAVGYRPRRVRHFDPYAPMFLGHFLGCVCSLLALVVMAYLSFLFYSSHGIISLVVYYVVPLILFGSYAVVITFLHHSEINVPWYADSNWDFVKGQLSTVDRDYGLIHEIIHSIGTHQMHHMFTKIPHYHLEEATRNFRQAFPNLVRTCEEPILTSFVRMFRKYDQQSIIEDDDVKQYAYK